MVEGQSPAAAIAGHQCYAVLTAMAQVIVTKDLVNEAFVRERCDWSELKDWAHSRSAGQQPEQPAIAPASVDPTGLRAGRGSTPTAQTLRSQLRDRRHRT